MSDRTYTLTYDELDAILAYAVHRPDCNLVTYRRDKAEACSCGFVKATLAIRRHEYFDHDGLVINRNVFGGRSIPAWLTDLVPPKYRKVSHRNPGKPSEMSDG